MDQLVSILRSHKLKVTDTRIQVLQAFLDKEYALSHSELEGMLDANLDRVTLYRTLSSFESKGVIHRVHKGDKVLRYAMCKDGCGSGHVDSHVHFSCNSCDHIFCLDHVEIPQVAVPSKFKVDNFYFLIEGICDTCMLSSI